MLDITRRAPTRNLDVLREMLGKKHRRTKRDPGTNVPVRPLQTTYLINWRGYCRAAVNKAYSGSNNGITDIFLLNITGIQGGICSAFRVYLQINVVNLQRSKICFQKHSLAIKIFGFHEHTKHCPVKFHARVRKNLPGELISKKTNQVRVGRLRFRTTET